MSEFDKVKFDQQLQALLKEKNIYTDYLQIKQQIKDDQELQTLLINQINLQKELVDLTELKLTNQFAKKEQELQLIDYKISVNPLIVTRNEIREILLMENALIKMEIRKI